MVQDEPGHTRPPVGSWPRASARPSEAAWGRLRRRGAAARRSPGSLETTGEDRWPVGCDAKNEFEKEKC